jgi:hypothetical protein
MFKNNDLIIAALFILILMWVVESNNRDNPCHVRAIHPSECNSDVRSMGVE